MGLSVEEKILIEQRVANAKKSVGAGYLLLIFFGLLGAHRFYLDSIGPAVAMLLLFLFSLLTFWIFVGFVTFFAVCIWWLVDLFLIPSLVARHENLVRSRITAQVMAESQA